VWNCGNTNQNKHEILPYLSQDGSEQEQQQKSKQTLNSGKDVEKKELIYC
jgi:hypothetical protein